MTDDQTPKDGDAAHADAGFLRALGIPTRRPERDAEPDDGRPDFDGGVRQPPTMPSDPAKDHDELVADLLSIPKSPPEEW